MGPLPLEYCWKHDEAPSTSGHPIGLRLRVAQPKCKRTTTHAGAQDSHLPSAKPGQAMSSRVNGRKFWAKTLEIQWTYATSCYHFDPLYIHFVLLFHRNDSIWGKILLHLCHSWNPHGGSWLVIVDAVPSTAGWNAALQRASHVRLHGPTTPWQHQRIAIVSACIKSGFKIL